MPSIQTGELRFLISAIEDPQIIEALRVQAIRTSNPPALSSIEDLTRAIESLSTVPEQNLAQIGELRSALAKLVADHASSGTQVSLDALLPEDLKLLNQVINALDGTQNTVEALAAQGRREGYLDSTWSREDHYQSLADTIASAHLTAQRAAEQLRNLATVAARKSGVFGNSHAYTDQIGFSGQQAAAIDPILITKSKPEPFHARQKRLKHEIESALRRVPHDIAADPLKFEAWLRTQLRSAVGEMLFEITIIPPLPTHDLIEGAKRQQQAKGILNQKVMALAEKQGLLTVTDIDEVKIAQGGRIRFTSLASHPVQALLESIAWSKLHSELASIRRSPSASEEMKDRARRTKTLLGELQKGELELGQITADFLEDVAFIADWVSIRDSESTRFTAGNESFDWQVQRARLATLRDLKNIVNPSAINAEYVQTALAQNASSLPPVDRTVLAKDLSAALQVLEAGSTTDPQTWEQVIEKLVEAGLAEDFENCLSALGDPLTDLHRELAASPKGEKILAAINNEGGRKTIGKLADAVWGTEIKTQDEFDRRMQTADPRRGKRPK